MSKKTDSQKGIPIGVLDDFKLSSNDIEELNNVVNFNYHPNKESFISKINSAIHFYHSFKDNKPIYSETAQNLENIHKHSSELVTLLENIDGTSWRLLKVRDDAHRMNSILAKQSESALNDVKKLLKRGRRSEPERNRLAYDCYWALLEELDIEPDVNEQGTWANLVRFVIAIAGASAKNTKDEDRDVSKLIRKVIKIINVERNFTSP